MYREVLPGRAWGGENVECRDQIRSVDNGLITARDSLDRGDRPDGLWVTIRESWILTVDID